MVNEDLLAALQELLDSTNVMASGQLLSEPELERYQRARDWARRLINREGNS